MPYTIVDPIEYEARIERARLSGEITNTEAMKRILDNRRAIDSSWEERQAQESAARDAAARRRAASKLEDERNATEKARQKYINDAPERARQAEITAEYKERQERAKRAELHERAEIERSRRYQAMRDRQPSSGSNSAPTGQSNPRSADTISGQSYRGYTPSGTGGSNSGNGGGSSRPSGGSPSNSSPVIEKNRPMSNPSWGSGETSAAQAAKGRPPVSAPSGTPARPAPFSPNRTPAMGGGATGAIGSIIGGEILGKVAQEAGLAVGRNLREIWPEFYGLQRDPVTGRLRKIQDPNAGDPFKSRKKGEPEPDPDDPFGDPNRPEGRKPIDPPIGTRGVKYKVTVDRYNPLANPSNARGSMVVNGPVGPPQTIKTANGGYWGMQTGMNSDGSGGEFSVFVSFSLGGDVGWTYTTLIEPLITPTEGEPNPFPDSQPENLPDTSAPLAPEYSPNKTPAPTPNPVPSSSPEGSFAPIALPLGGSLPSPGGDRTPRPELKPENEIKPKLRQPLEPGFTPSFRPEGDSKPETKPGSEPGSEPGSRTIKKYEPLGAGAPDPKPGFDPQNDPKTDPRQRDKKFFDPLKTPDPAPNPVPDPKPAPAPVPTLPGLCRFEKCDLPKPQKIKVKVFKGCDRKQDGSPDYFGELELTVTSGDGAAWKKALDDQADLLAQKCEIAPCDVAIPEAWAVRVGTDRPQLVIVFTEIFSSGKLGRSRWAVTVPHYNRGEKATISAPSYRRGSWVGRLALNDGSSLNVNAASSTECKRAINKLKILIPNSFRINAQGKAIKPRIAENPDLNLKEVNVVPIFAKFFATGQKTLAPTWSKSLRK